MIPHKKLEIFCGTGGVGKTTLATSRALFLGKDPNNKVLLMTVDPAIRLKQVLNLSEENAGKTEVFERDGIKITALLMNPALTLKNLFSKNNLTAGLQNQILGILSRPHGGLNEILGLLELQKHFNSDEYTHIILDTPPGHHFVDFLTSGEKIKRFFEKNFIEIFDYLAGEKKPKGIIKKMINTGVQKLLHYLEKVTGKEFVDNFIQAIELIFKLKNSFLAAANLPQKLREDDLANWFLVSSSEQSKMFEALELQSDFKKFSGRHSFFLINKSLKEEIKDWEPALENQKNLKESLLSKESLIEQTAKKSFDQIFLFKEIAEKGPIQQVIALSNLWNDYQ